jgi:threonine/homoserine/homoserine lactone efflux protein
MTLEAKYRRFTRLFPPAWRERNEEELVATLLDAAEPGQDTVTTAEALDLVGSAFVLRLRSALDTPVASRLRQVARLTAVGASVVASVVAVAAIMWFWVGSVSAEFLLVSLVVALVPGAGVVYTVSSSISGGWDRGLFASIGCTLGIVPHVLAAMLGLSGVIQAGAAAFEAVRWVGVAYLLIVGVSMIRERGSLRLEHDQPGSTVSRATVVWRAILVNLLNPKLTVFFFAFLPQFLDTPPGLLDPRLAGLGAAFMVVTLVVFAGYAWTSALARELVLGAPAVRRWVQRSLGGLVVGFAARLAVTDR